MSKPTRPQVPSSATARLQLATGEVVAVEGGVAVQTDYERIYSERATMADMAWEQEHGDHTHRFTGKPRKAEVTEARLGSRHVDCDGSCGGVCGGEGYDVSVWLCAHDGAELEPRYVDDWEARTSGIVVGVTRTYRLTLRRFPPFDPIEGATVQRVVDGSVLDLPPLVPGEMSFSSEDDAPAIQYSGVAYEAVTA